MTKSDLVTFTEEILNEKLHFLRSVGVTRLKKTVFVWGTGGVISCVWSALGWANVGYAGFFFTYDEYGFSLKGSWSYSR